MSRFKMIADIRKRKEQNQENHLYINQINELSLKKTDDIVLGVKNGKRSIYSSDKNNHKENSEIDTELLKLWDYLKVTNDFRKRFIQKLSYFSQEYKKIIIESEKQQVKKTYDLIIKIINESMAKERDIEYLKTFQITSSHYMDGKDFNEAKKKLISLKYHIINYLQLINELRNISCLDIQYGKIDLEKVNLYNYIKPEYFVKLNQELKSIQKSNIGKIFKIKEVYDILFMDFDDEKIDKKRNYVAYQVFINEFIHFNYNPKINKIYFKNLEKTNIDAGMNQNLKKSRSKDIFKVNLANDKKKKNNIEFKNSSKDDDNFNEDDYSNEENSKNKNLQFFTKDISKLKETYNNYYNIIPKDQKIIFNIKDNLMEYIKGINPMFIIKKNYNDITFFCSMEYSKEDDNTLQITNFSINNHEIKNGIEELLKFLSDKNVIYQYLTIDLYYENIDGKLILNKEINEIFKNLKFRWSKLENKDGGIRYQKMKYTNPDYIENTFIDNHALNLISGLIVYHGNNPMENLKNSNNFIFNFNNFNMDIIEKINENRNEDLNLMNSLIKNLYFNHCSDLSEINQILNVEHLNIKLPLIEKDNKILYNLFKINTQFDSLVSVEINNKRYFRINSPIQVLIEKKTQQKFYMIMMKDGNYLIIGEPNNEFNKILNKKENNLYTIFNNNQLESSQEEISSIYIPEINCEMLSTGNNIRGTKINDIQQIYSFYKFYQNKEKNNYVIKISPSENDIIITNNFLIAIINTDIAKQFNFPIIFCALLDNK